MQRLKRLTIGDQRSRKMGDASCPFCLCEDKSLADVSEQHVLKTEKNTLCLEISCRNTKFCKPRLKHQVCTTCQAGEVSSQLQGAILVCQNLTRQKLIYCQSAGFAVSLLTAWPSPEVSGHLHGYTAWPRPLAAPVAGPHQSCFHQIHCLVQSPDGSWISLEQLCLLSLWCEAREDV